MNSKFPADLNLESLPGFENNLQYYVPNEICWNEWGTRFVLIYSISERSMMNDVGYLAWGMKGENGSSILGTIHPIGAACCTPPSTRWINATTFIFEAQYWDGKKTYTPLVAIKTGTEVDFQFALFPKPKEFLSLDASEMNKAFWYPFSVENLKWRVTAAK